jgi:hypothetical protein
MNKVRVLLTASLLAAALLFFMGCPTGDEEDETTTTAAPVLDHVPAFDINNLPDPAYWNSQGHMHVFPDLFTFADGTRVKNLTDWQQRRKEISKIIQYYEYGVMPSIGTAAEQANNTGVIITFENSGQANTKLIVTYGRRVFNFTINTTLPAGAGAADKGHLGLYFDSSGTNWSGGTANFPLATFARESDGAGEVQTLFSIKVADASAPSANVSYAWGMSVILSAMEGIDLNGNGSLGVDADGNITDQTEYENEHAFKGWYDPRKVGITGYSRNGKAAECIAAFAESRGGVRVGHVSIGSAGSGGPALERFLSPAGYYLNGQPADPLPPDAPGLMKFDSMIGKPWYMKKINNGDTLIDGPAVAASGGSSDEFRYRAVRGWSPYFESYGLSPTNYGQASTPFVGWQNPAGVGAGSWSGIQSLSEGRNETPGWFSPRFREFTDLHMGLDIDHVVGNNDRGKYGILCTIPFDQHFLSALIAPNGILFQDGFVVPRNNPEGQFANWLMIDEIYKFYGEQEGAWDKYIWRNGATFIWGTHGGNTGNETSDRNYHASKVFADYDKKSDKSFYNTWSGAAALDTAAARADYNIFKFRDPLYPVDDPIGRFDYYRANWGRPRDAAGSQTPTIAERVRKRIPDALLADYAAGEASRPRPSYQTTLPAHPNYTPTGPQFKPMDWRGLIDDPENL